MGTYPSYFAAREWALAAGQPFTDKDVDLASKVAVLGSRVADKLFGDVDPLGQIVRVANIPFTVIGVRHPKGQSADGWDQDDTILAPFSTAMLRVLGAQKGATRRAVG